MAQLPRTNDALVLLPTLVLALPVLPLQPCTIITTIGIRIRDPIVMKMFCSLYNYLPI